MGSLKVLDCTLRDGGYCNQWRFGYKNIKKIIDSLIESGIDIVECGFLTENEKYDADTTKYVTIRELETLLPKQRGRTMFTCMVNYGEYNASHLPEHDSRSLDGIRVAFHKKDCADALALCRQIKEKGYKVFIQAMVSLSYSDEEFLELIGRVNEVEPYAFYIVDSFGMMKHKDLIRLFYMVEHNLKGNILIGFHSHNNMQLSYSNAQSLVDIRTKRDLIIDSSVYGMGRGAGNLNTELFLEYLNDNANGNYVLQPLFHIIDEILSQFYRENYWGYSLPNYLSASHKLHPNYARYLDDKKTLLVEDIDAIFQMVDEKKRFEFDKDYIETLYLEYMAKDQVKDDAKMELAGKLHDKTVLLIAPGKSAEEEKSKLMAYSKNQDVVVISVNFEYEYMNTDYIFVSNLRRYHELDKVKRKKCLVTSNIMDEGVYLQIKYRDLLNNHESVRDNAGMMAIKFLIGFHVQKILLAGFDGYSGDAGNNYLNPDLATEMSSMIQIEKNRGIEEVLNQFKKDIHIEFLTTPKFITLDKIESAQS